MKILYVIKINCIDKYSDLYKLELNDSNFKIATKYIPSTIILIINEYIPIENELTLDQAYIKILQSIKKYNIVDKNYYNGEFSNLVKIIESYINKSRIHQYQNVNGVIELNYKTKNNYVQIIKKLKNLNINVDKITEIEINKIMDLPLQFSTKGNYFSALKNYIVCNSQNKEELKLVEDKIKEVSISKDAFNKSNQLSHTQRDNIISYKTVLEINDRLDLFSQSNSYGKLYSIIVQLYVYQPPRRTLDYSELYYKPIIELDNESLVLWIDETKILGNYKKHKILCNDEDKNKNYFGKYNDTYMFIFNRYKTFSTYGVQYIEVNSILGKNICNYITENNIQHGNKIFKSNEVSFQEKVNKIFQIYTNKKIGPSMLRHIYIIDFLSKPNITINTREITGMKMGHNITTQAEYNKIVDPEILNSSQIIDNPPEINFMGYFKPKIKVTQMITQDKRTKCNTINS